VVSIQIPTNPAHKRVNSRHTTAKFNDNPSIDKTSIGIASLLSACKSFNQDAGHFAAIVADMASLVDEEDWQSAKRVDPSTAIGSNFDLDRSDLDSTSNKTIHKERNVHFCFFP
jgi:hypothetical protein